MNVLQINNCHYDRGGADIVYLNTIELLEQNGYNVICFSTKNEKNKKNKFEKYFTPAPDFNNTNFLKKFLNIPRFIFSFSTIANLNALLKKYNPDIAHIHLYKGGLTSSILKVLKKNKIPIIISVHDYGLLDPHNLLLDGNLNITEKTINGSPFNAFLDKHNRNSYLYSFISYLEYSFHSFFLPFDKYFDTVLCVSSFSKSLHSSSSRFNFNLRHLYNFSPMVKHKISNKKNNNERYILFFGRLSKEKGVLTLIKAYENLQTSYTLKILGTGSMESELKEYVKENNLKNIEFLGHIGGQALISHIKNAYVVIVPSEWYENNPMTIIESYALSVPVIGSSIGGIPEIIQNGSTGYTFEMSNVNDLCDKLNLMLSLTKDEYENFKINCFEFAKNNFSEDVYFETLVSLYSETINNYEK